MATTYYVEGIHYGSLSNLLSEGWPEDKTVDIWMAGRPSEETTIARLRTAVVTRRVVAVANEGFAEHAPGGGYQYAVAIITEDEPGWVARNWYRTLAEAQAAAVSFNRKARHTSDEVLDVQISSMRAGRVR